MLRLYQSNRLEILADRLAERLAEPQGNPLAPETLVVQHSGMARWLSLRLAKRLGVCANVEFPLPAAFVWRLVGALLPGLPDENRFEPGVLAWRILGLLDELPEAPELAPLQRYLGDRDLLKRLQLAQRIAAVFDQYLVYRPDWILAWEAGRPAQPGDEWQAWLWRRLSASGDPHWVRLQQRMFAALDAGAMPVGRLPERAAVFGIPTLSPGYLEILQRLGEHMELHLFLLNPCRAHWSEIVDLGEKARREVEADGSELYLEVGNPLLASLGRQGRDLFDALLAVEGETEEGFVDPDPGHLLGRLQADILDLSDPTQAESPWALDPNDRSLQFHACHSPMRELEVLYDQLLELFRRDPELEPSQVIVMTPDIDVYAPYVQAVFGEPGDRPAIPYHIADRDAAGEWPLVAACLQLLELPERRLDANRVLGLLELPALRRSFRIEGADLPLIARWIEQTGIRWGADAADRAAQGQPADAENTWRAGLDRLLLGYALVDEGDDLFQGLLPYNGVDGADSARLAGCLLAFIDALTWLRKRLQRSRPMAAWVRELGQLLERFFSPEEDEAHQLQRVRAALDAALEQAEFADYKGDLDRAVLRAELQGQLQAGAGGGGFLGGGVAFCSLAPMRSLPFPVICLLGMDDGAFPRERRPPGFDLMARRFRFGDRSRRGDDRYLFLETLISARRCLYLSYVGQDQRDNAPLPPSALVSELLDYLDQLADGAARKQLLTHHPLQPFSRRHFQPDSGLFSYSPALAAAARRLGEAAAAPAPLLPGDLMEPEPEWRQIELPRLLHFYSNPTRFLLQQRLGIRLEPGEGLAETRDPFGLDFFPRQELAQALVEQALEGRGGAALEARWRAAGQLPQGNIGARLFAREADQAAALAVNLGQVLAPAPERSLAVDLPLGELRLVGTLSGVRPDGLFGYSVHKIWDAQLIELWLRHLLLNALAPPGVDLVSRWLDPERLYRFPPRADAGERLSELLSAYWQGLCRPLPLFPKSSLAYVRKIASGKDPEYALKAAEQVWGGTFTPNPEGDNPYYRLAFPDGVAFGQEFDRLSRQLLLPLAEALREPD